MKTARFLFSAAAALMVLCAGVASAQETLQIISPHWQGIKDEFGPAFESHWQGTTGGKIKVVWRDMGGTSDDLRWIRSEFAKRPEGIDLDIFFGGGIDPYRQLAGLGVLQPHKVPEAILSGIPKDLGGVALYDPGYRWYGTAISGFGIIYNKVLLQRLKIAEPKTWQDLADPKLFTWVGTGDPRHSGTVHMMYEIILQAYGWERGWQIITAMSANTRTIVQNSGDIPTSVAAGRVAVGTAIDFYAWTQVNQAGSDFVGFVMPEGLTVINPDSIAVLKGAPNEKAAKAFVEFVLSEAGQKLWYLKAGAPGGPKKYDLFRMPVRADLYEKFAAESPVTMNPFLHSKSFKYDSNLGMARYEALSDLIGATLVDCHDDLVSAWSKIVRAEPSEELLGQLAAPPLSETELTALAEEKLKDPVFRNAQIGRWATFARDKYRRLTEAE
ncbi:MAG: ABC transporter substrate-binding protein [Planctomycetes bacterium]|nr:ABC transporter substrate-binding protein [Planctomycetota bacterium]